MLQHVHKHILNELKQSARTDTIFIVSAVLYNLVVLGINWGVAAGENPKRGHPPENDLILILLILATILINFFIIKALKSGKATRMKLLDGLIRMYKDNKVDNYYQPDLLQAYTARYRLFMIIISILGSIAILVPLMARLIGQ